MSNIAVIRVHEKMKIDFDKIDPFVIRKQLYKLGFRLSRFLRCCNDRSVFFGREYRHAKDHIMYVPKSNAGDFIDRLADVISYISWRKRITTRAWYLKYFPDAVLGEVHGDYERF